MVPASADLLVTVAPAGASAAWPDQGEAALSAAARYPSGTRVLRLGSSSPEVLSTGLDAAGAPLRSCDGERLLFLGRAAAGEPFQLYEAGSSGGQPRRLTAFEHGLRAAACLPDGRLLVQVEQAAGDPAGGGGLTALYRTDAKGASVDGAAAERISHGHGRWADPVVLADGRVLVAAWQEPAAAWGLLALHPDGTGLAAVQPATAGAPLKRLVRQVAGGDLVYLAVQDGAAIPVTLSWLRPHAGPQGLHLPAGRWRELRPTTDGGWLAVFRPQQQAQQQAQGSGPAGVYRVEPGRTDGPAQAEMVYAPADGDCLEVLDLGAIPSRPQGHLSMVKPEQAAWLVGLDGRRGPGVAKAQRVRVLAWTDGDQPDRVLGELDLADDGSWFCTVPPDVPLGFEALDEQGRVLARHDTPVWVRPNERRACLGCHESPGLGPVNRVPSATLADPQDLAAGASRPAVNGTGGGR